MNCTVLLCLVVCACAAANNYRKIPRLGDYEKCDELLCNNIITDADVPDAGAPDSWDWRDHYPVNPRRNIGLCESYNIVSAIVSLESQYTMKYKKNLPLSVQQIIDCANGRYNINQCDSGCITVVFLYLMEIGGVMTESDYPYTSDDGRVDDICMFNESKVAVKVADCTSYNLTSQNKLKQLLYRTGPLAVALDVPPALPVHGVWQNCTKTNLNYGALLLGYGTDPKHGDYWVVDVWAPKVDSFRIERGDNVESCGILNGYMTSVEVA